MHLPLFSRAAGLQPLLDIVASDAGGREAEALQYRYGFDSLELLPWALVPFRLKNQIYNDAALRFDDPLMGIRVGLVAGADAFRPLLDFADRGTTLAEVIDRAIDVLAWHCNAFTTSLRIAGERVRWSIAYAEFAPAAVAQHAARPLIQMAQLVRRHGGDAARIEIEFDGLPIAERQRAETLLGIAVQPVAGATAVTFPAQWLGGSPGIPASHRATAPTPDYAECPLPATIAEAVRCVLDLHAEAPACDIEQVSAELGSSRRMLQYGLAGEGTNFRDILRNARIDHARHLLANSAIPIAEIAVEVGYYDQANFHRAFFGTTGQTPRHYREAFRG